MNDIVKQLLMLMLNDITIMLNNYFDCNRICKDCYYKINKTSIITAIISEGDKVRDIVRESMRNL
jgi:hypothetical protein